MRASSSTYRLLAILVVSVMTWPVVLPVVHMACAMETDVMAATCRHEATHDHEATHGQMTGHEPTPAARVEHDIHVHPLLEADAVVDPDSQPQAMACCIVEAGGRDRPAIPARIGDDTPRVALGSLVAAHTHTVPPPRSVDLPRVLPVAPNTPPLSIAFLSVFLI